MAIDVAAHRTNWNSGVLAVGGDFGSGWANNEPIPLTEVPPLLLLLLADMGVGELLLWCDRENIWVNIESDDMPGDGELLPRCTRDGVPLEERRSGAEELCLCWHLISLAHSSWLQSSEPRCNSPWVAKINRTESAFEVSRSLLKQNRLMALETDSSSWP